MAKSGGGGRGGGGRDRAGRDRGGRDRGGRDRPGAGGGRGGRAGNAGGRGGGGARGGHRSPARSGGRPSSAAATHGRSNGIARKEAAKKDLKAIGIRPRSENRTVHQQAKAMLKAAEKKPKDDLGKYGKGAYVKSMRAWVRNHPTASRDQGVKAFEKMIRDARANHAKVSDHLDKRAIDIREPKTKAERDKILEIIRRNGGVLKKEPRAAGGPHWHISFPNRK